MTTPDPSKMHAAVLAAEMVQHGMTVGLGSGSTATLMIERLGRRVRDEGLDFVGIPTSEGTAQLALSGGIRLVDLDAIKTLDLNLDGADEVDPEFRMVKGRGGALLREKIVAAAARRRVFIVGDDKFVGRLGEHFPIPVEASPFGIGHTEEAIRDLGASVVLRKDESGRAPYTTDGGNRILDCRFERGIDDPSALDTQLRTIPGVFETGLFLGLCDALIVGHPDRAELIEARRR